MRLFFAITAWLFLLAIGNIWLIDFELTPSELGSPPDTWPAAAGISEHGMLPQLLLFAHPKCPCTRASMAELSRVMKRCQTLVETHIIFLKPESTPSGWEQTELWNAAHLIPGVRVIADQGNRLGTLFNVSTSGTVLLYDAQKQRVFHGGITTSRGQEGASPGGTAIISWIKSQREIRQTTPVYGCSLCEKPTSQFPRGDATCPTQTDLRLTYPE